MVWLGCEFGVEGGGRKWARRGAPGARATRSEPGAADCTPVPLCSSSERVDWRDAASSRHDGEYVSLRTFSTNVICMFTVPLSRCSVLLVLLVRLRLHLRRHTVLTWSLRQGSASPLLRQLARVSLYASFSSLFFLMFLRYVLLFSH